MSASYARNDVCRLPHTHLATPSDIATPFHRYGHQIILNTKKHCAKLSLPATYMVRDKALPAPLKFLGHGALYMIIGAYIVVYVASVYIFL